MKQALSIFSAMFVCLNFCIAQATEKPRVNSLTLELGKTGLIYNLTYDHRFGISDIGFRVGAGSNFSKYLNAISFGGGGYYLAGKEKHFLELGVDIQYLIVDEVSDDQKDFTFVYPDYSTKSIYPSLNIGYRNYGKKTLFRIGFSPGLIDGEFVPGGYISFGVTF